MSDTLTLLQVRTRVRERADMVGSLFVTDAELNGYINYSYRALWDLLIEADDDYGTKSATFTITSGNTITLPSDFYKLRGVDDLTDSTHPRTVRKFNWNERNNYKYSSRNVLNDNSSDVFYRIIGDTLLIEPPESALKTYRLWYVRTVATVTLDADPLDGIQGWLEYVIVDSAMKCLVKEESDISSLQAMKGEIMERIVRLRNNRDQSLPEKISRVRKDRNTFWSNSPGDFYP